MDVPPPQQIERVLLSETSRYIWLDHGKLWKGYARPALLLKLTGGRTLVVDFQATTHSGYADQVNVLDSRFDAEGTFITPWPMWHTEEKLASGSMPDHVITYSFSNSLGIRKWGISTQCRESYSDPRHTRDVLREIIKEAELQTLSDSI